MQISRELLLAKRKQAEADRDLALAKANAQIGAINLIDHLLSVIEVPKAPATPPATATNSTTNP